MTRSDGREAVERDEYARLRDLTARARDQAAEARDRWTAARTRSREQEEASREELIAALKRSTTAARTIAAADRARAAADRRMAARDRKQAALDRSQAESDVGRAREDVLASIYTGDRDQVALRHEIARAKRTGEPLVLAFITVEGDAQEVLSAVGSRLRSYDPIVGISGTEFVCGMSSTPLPTSDHRMKEIQETIEQRRLNGSMRVALAELQPDEILEEVLRRGKGD